MDGAGYKKILQACRIAAAGGYRVRSDPGLLSMPSIWIWVDTCCIDKASSAEVSEAINSMYRIGTVSHSSATSSCMMLQSTTIGRKQSQNLFEASGLIVSGRSRNYCPLESDFPG